MSLLQIKHLQKTFSTKPDLIGRGLKAMGIKTNEAPAVQAVRDVSFHVNQGEVLGLIGESGCGKSTIARMIAGITPVTAGEIIFDGQNILDSSSKEAQAASLDIQMVFQDAAAAMNPRYKIRDIITEAPLFHGRMKHQEVNDRVAEILEAVSLSADFANRFPHQLSGGQRQRIGIARALAMKPRLMICDESVAALDVSIQAQVINLFMDLREKFGLTYIFISHDLSVVRHISDRVAIMYLGEIVETASKDAIFSDPAHPYTRALIEQNPSIKNRQREHKPIEGEVPSPLNPPSGCYFHPRCRSAFAPCAVQHPILHTISGSHQAACHLYNVNESQ